MPATLLHTTAGICGFVLVWIALFLTETEEGKLQNRLVELWVRVDDLSKTAMTKEAALIQQAFGMLSHALDKLLGTKLWSWRVIATSAGFSVASACLFALWQMHVNDSFTMKDGALVVFTLAIALFFSTAPGILRYGTFLVVVCLAVASFHYLEDRDAAVEIDLGVFVGGLLCDLLLLTFIRWLLGRGSELTRTTKLVFLVVLDLCIGIALVCPLFLIDLSDLDEGIVDGGLAVLVFIGASNLFTAFVCFLLVLLLAAALLNRFVWPVVSRPIYAAQRYGLVNHPKLLGALGASCLQFAWPNNPLIIAIVKLLHYPT
jgi:hypothetical protein